MRARLLVVFGMVGWALTACVRPSIVELPSNNRSSRVDYVVIHFTSESFARSVELLTQRSDNPVSAHYLIPEPDDPTYTDDSVRVHRLVDEAERAWHAGQSHWHGELALNSRSLGIELVNQSRCVEDRAVPQVERTWRDVECDFRPFAESQIERLIELLREILDRHRRIDPVDVVGHADIAPGRRSDPGPLFPWRRLYDAGIGAWFDDPVAERYRQQFADTLPSLGELQRALRSYGYAVDDTGVPDEQSALATRAFQMHFRPAKVTGSFDTETAAILYALLEKYRSDSD